MLFGPGLLLFLIKIWDRIWFIFCFVNQLARPVNSSVFIYFKLLLFFFYLDWHLLQNTDQGVCY